jgi:hypothetical protein
MSRFAVAVSLFVLLSAATASSQTLLIPADDREAFLGQASPSVASNGDDFLAVWQDFRRGSSAAPGIAAAYGRVDRRAALCFLMSSFDCANPFKSNASNAGLAELFPDALLYVGRRRVWWWSCDSRRDWETVARCGP